MELIQWGLLVLSACSWILENEQLEIALYMSLNVTLNNFCYSTDYSSCYCNYNNYSELWLTNNIVMISVTPLIIVAAVAAVAAVYTATCNLIVISINVMVSVISFARIYISLRGLVFLSQT